jgi:hypothetical protein
LWQIGEKVQTRKCKSDFLSHNSAPAEPGNAPSEVQKFRECTNIHSHNQPGADSGPWPDSPKNTDTNLSDRYNTARPFEGAEAQLSLCSAVPPGTPDRHNTPATENSCVLFRASRKFACPFQRTNQKSKKPHKYLGGEETKPQNQKTNSRGASLSLLVVAREPTLIGAVVCDTTRVLPSSLLGSAAKPSTAASASHF